MVTEQKISSFLLLAQTVILSTKPHKSIQLSVPLFFFFKGILIWHLSPILTQEHSPTKVFMLYSSVHSSKILLSEVRQPTETQRKENDYVIHLIHFYSHGKLSNQFQFAVQVACMARDTEKHCWTVVQTSGKGCWVEFSVLLSRTWESWQMTI